MSQYAAPEGFKWDEVLGKYVNIQILSDESGVKYRRIVSFDADNGTYDQQLIPISEEPKKQRPAPPPLPQRIRSSSSTIAPAKIANPLGNSSSRSKTVKFSRPQNIKSNRHSVRWLIPVIVFASILIVGISIYSGYRKLKVDALGYGMMMNDEEVVELLDMDSFEERVDSFYVYDGDFIEEGIVK